MISRQHILGQNNVTRYQEGHENLLELTSFHIIKSLYCRLPQQIPGLKQVEGLSTDNLLKTCMIIFFRVQATHQICFIWGH